MCEKLQSWKKISLFYSINFFGQSSFSSYSINFFGQSSFSSEASKLLEPKMQLVFDMKIQINC